MRDTELRRLGRGDLIEIIYQLQQEKEQLLRENEDLRSVNEKLERMTDFSQGGEQSFARINAASETLERALKEAGLYLRSIADMRERARRDLAETQRLLSMAREESEKSFGTAVNNNNEGN